MYKGTYVGIDDIYQRYVHVWTKLFSKRILLLGVVHGVEWRSFLKKMIGHWIQANSRKRKSRSDKGKKKKTRTRGTAVLYNMVPYAT
jgi:hypothetical protein